MAESSGETRGTVDPSVARCDDLALGRKDDLDVDRAAVRAVESLVPEAGVLAEVNRSPAHPGDPVPRRLGGDRPVLIPSSPGSDEGLVPLPDWWPEFCIVGAVGRKA